MYIIIVGAGKIGSALLDVATGQSHDIVVVEKNPEVADEINRQFDCLVINGDATARETLQEAGIKEADALIATTDADAVNLMVCMLAEELAVESIVSVVHENGNQAMFRKLGVNVMANPPSMIADHLYRAVQRPSIRDFMELGNGAEVFEVTVNEKSPMNGVSLLQANEENILPSDTIIICVIRDGNLIVPQGSTEIEGGDLVTVFSRHGASKEVTSLFTDEKQ